MKIKYGNKKPSQEMPDYHNFTRREGGKDIRSGSPSGVSGMFKSTQLISELVRLAMLDVLLLRPDLLPITRGRSRITFLEPGTLT